MITFLDGSLAAALPTQAVIDVRGVGYEVLIPLSSYDRLPPPGQNIRILTHLHVREDAQILYGFMTAPERDQGEDRFVRLSLLGSRRVFCTGRFPRRRDSEFILQLEHDPFSGLFAEAADF